VVQESERIREWIGPTPRAIGCLVSLGTGTPHYVEVEPRLDRMLQACITMMTDSNDIAESFARSRFGRELAVANRYFRFNVPLGMGDLELDDWKATSKMRDLTLEYLRNVGSGCEVERCAKSLLNPDSNLQAGTTTTNLQ
jgi:hypothetical protein